MPLSLVLHWVFTNEFRSVGWRFVVVVVVVDAFGAEMAVRGRDVEIRQETQAQDGKNR